MGVVAISFRTIDQVDTCLRLSTTTLGESLPTIIFRKLERVGPVRSRVKFFRPGARFSRVVIFLGHFFFDCTMLAADDDSGEGVPETRGVTLNGGDPRQLEIRS